MTIYFYTKNDPFFEFSNFAPYGIEIDGVWWDTIEHYFQAQKFDSMEYRERIRRARTPKDAAALGRSREVPIRSDWEAAKVEIMRAAILRKFRTHESPRQLLLSTKDEEIVENSPGDFFWGAGSDGTGLNKLGSILMEIRDQLRRESADTQ